MSIESSMKKKTNIPIVPALFLNIVRFADKKRYFKYPYMLLLCGWISILIINVTLCFSRLQNWMHFPTILVSEEVIGSSWYWIMVFGILSSIVRRILDSDVSTCIEQWMEYCGHSLSVCEAIMFGMLWNELGKVIIAEFGSRYFD